MTPSTEELISDVLGGRRSGFEELVKRHERSVLGVCWAILRDDHAARDACQETFVAAFQHLGGLRSPATFGAWVMAIARRKAYRELQRRRREGAADAQQLAEVASTDGQDNEALDVLEQVARLPDHEREAVLLHYFDHQTVEEVSQSTGRSVGTITKQLTRARRHLRQWFEQEAVR